MRWFFSTTSSALTYTLFLAAAYYEDCFGITIHKSKTEVQSSRGPPPLEGRPTSGPLPHWTRTDQPALDTEQYLTVAAVSSQRKMRQQQQSQPHSQRSQMGPNVGTATSAGSSASVDAVIRQQRQTIPGGSTNSDPEYNRKMQAYQQLLLQQQQQQQYMYQHK